jgi:hypothetical protein
MEFVKRSKQQHKVYLNIYLVEAVVSYLKKKNNSYDFSEEPVMWELAIELLIKCKPLILIEGNYIQDFIKKYLQSEVNIQLALINQVIRLFEKFVEEIQGLQFAIQQATRMLFEIIFDTNDSLQNDVNWDLKSKLIQGAVLALNKNKTIDLRGEKIQFCKSNPETTLYVLQKVTQNLLQHCNYSGLDNSRLQLHQLQTWNVLFASQALETLVNIEGLKGHSAFQEMIEVHANTPSLQDSVGKLLNFYILNFEVSSPEIINNLSQVKKIFFFLYIYKKSEIAHTLGLFQTDSEKSLQTDESSEDGEELCHPDSQNFDPGDHKMGPGAC